MDQANNFEYRGWHVRLEVTGSGRIFSGAAHLAFEGDKKCRLVLESERADAVSARWALDSKARDYIDDWHSKRHTGNTGFGDIGDV